MDVHCSNCSATENINDAVENGEWIPYFWSEPLDEEIGPTCPVCVTKLGVVFDDAAGEFIQRGAA